MSVAGQLIKHFGLQMYSGAVPAIVELISNSYDAMAKNVWIEIPTGESIKTSDQIIVKDDGHGMSFAECNDNYLAVGRNRRTNRHKLTDAYNGLPPRKVQGRKGIGKLAGFGIANQLDIETVKDKKISCFRMDFEKLTESDEFADTGGVSLDPLEGDGEQTKESPYTKVTLLELKIKRKIVEADFRKSIARRLLILDGNFTVHINGQVLSRGEIPLQFRFPDGKGKWYSEKLKNGKEIKWWAGFCENTIPDEEQRGLVVYVRGKLAQTPWFFDLSGGVWGQHGLQYLTGEVKADFLDEEESDLIATDRGSIRWEDPLATSLQHWGKGKVKELLSEWVKKRSKHKKRSNVVLEYLELAEKLSPKERDIFKKIVSRICSIPQLDKDQEGKDIADELVEFAYHALTNRHLLEAIKQLKTMSSDDLEAMNQILHEWSIIEAVNVAHSVKGRVEIIRKFQQMIEDKVPEKPNMQNYLRDNPWLINPQWIMLTHEKAMDTIIETHFDGKKTGALSRPDFFCLGDGLNTAYAVEIKRPGKPATEEDLDQIRDYVRYLKGKCGREIVEGLLIVEDVPKALDDLVEMYKPFFRVTSWSTLLSTARTLNEGFLKAVTNRAPADDPMIQRLSDVDQHDQT